MKLSFALSVITIGLSILPASAGTAPTHLCKFENAFLPCNHLRVPAKAPLGVTFDYRPTKWTPIWPNFSIFGGLKPLKDGDVRILHEDFEAKPFDSSAPNIETTSPSEPTYDDSFVDNDLAFYSTWVDRGTRPVLALTRIDKVFHGSTIFEFWERAIKAGITCATKPDALFPEQTNRYCVFAREKTRTRKTREIEYCSLEEFKESGIRSSPTCTTVAAEENKVRHVFSARYTSTSFLGGASAGEYTCVMPNVPLSKVKEFVEAHVRGIVGPSSKYFAGKDQYDSNVYKAEGINIPDNREKLFLRAYVFGNFGDEGTTRSGMFSMNINVTVSYQASENIIDYREPNQALTDRLRNKFESQLKKGVQTAALKGECHSNFPW